MLFILHFLIFSSIFVFPLTKGSIYIYIQRRLSYSTPSLNVKFSMWERVQCRKYERTLAPAVVTAACLALCLLIKCVINILFHCYGIQMWTMFNFLFICMGSDIDIYIRSHKTKRKSLYLLLMMDDVITQATRYDTAKKVLIINSLAW